MYAGGDLIAVKLQQVIHADFRRSDRQGVCAFEKRQRKRRAHVRARLAPLIEIGLDCLQLRIDCGAARLLSLHKSFR